MGSWIQIEMSVDRAWTGVDVERVRRRVNKYGAKKRGLGSRSSWPLPLERNEDDLARTFKCKAGYCIRTSQILNASFILICRGEAASRLCVNVCTNPALQRKNVVASRRIIEGEKKTITINCPRCNKLSSIDNSIISLTNNRILSSFFYFFFFQRFKRGQELRTSFHRRLLEYRLIFYKR